MSIQVLAVPLTKRFDCPDGQHGGRCDAYEEAKACLKKARTPRTYLQSHLDEISWRICKKNHQQDLLCAFLDVVAMQYLYSWN